MSDRPIPRGLAALAALAAAALTACVNFIPEHQRPAAPVAASFPDAPASETATTPASDLEWQAFFGDERLRRLIALALHNNRDLRVAALNIEQARAQLQVRRADEWPTVNVGLGGTRLPDVNGRITSVYTTGLSVTNYELDLFGRVHSQSQVAQAQFFATEEARKAVQISLIAAVANAYLALRADDALLTLTEQTLVTREDSLRLTRLRFDNGVTTELDLRQAESLLEGTKATLAQIRRQRALDGNALVLLVGAPLPGDLPEPLAFDDARVAAEVPAGLPSDLLERRPDIRSAERSLMAAEANIGAAKAAFFPRITLTGSVGLVSQHLSSLFGDGVQAWGYSPQLLWPLFDAGRNQANLDAAKASREIAVAQYEKAVQIAFREVADALAGQATLADQLRAQQAQAGAEDVRARLADLRYRNGAASYLDVLDAQRSLFAARQAVVQVQLLRTQSQVALYKALGGGWKEPEGTTR